MENLRDNEFKLIRTKEREYLLSVLNNKEIITLINRAELTQDEAINVLRHLQDIKFKTEELYYIMRVLSLRLNFYQVATDCDVYCADFVNILSTKNLSLDLNKADYSIEALKILMVVLNTSNEIYHNELVKELLKKHEYLILKVLSLKEDDFTSDLKEWYSHYLSLIYI